MTRQPVRRADISTLMDKYETEQDYLESLNLRQVVSEVFKTLEKALTKVQEQIEASPTR